MERDTGISNQTLRAWERRYGFPSPQGDAGGERPYTSEQVLRLRLVKRLLDAGRRPDLRWRQQPGTAFARLSAGGALP